MSTVHRHDRTVRITHWLIALSGMLLLFSGFGQMPMYKRYNIVLIPGLSWSSNYEITLLLHYLGSIVFSAAVLFHLVYHTRRREFGIVPRRGDLGATLTGLRAMLGLAEEPAHGKFQAKQRVIYGIFGATILLLVVTGLVKSFKNLGPIVIDPPVLQWITYAHTIGSMGFLLLLIAHVAALLLKQHRPLIPSMVTGRLDREYARRHHPAWFTDQ